MKKARFLLTKDGVLFKRLGITFLVMTITRLIFLFANWGAFSGVRYTDFFAGIWMDAITIGIFFIPFYGFSALPHPFYSKKWYQIFLKTIFHITNSIIIILNLVDVEYFKFTAKRSTADLFATVTEDNHPGQLAKAFIVDFWWLILIFAVLFYGSNWLYNRTNKKQMSDYHFGFDLLNFIVVSFLLLVMGRGGFGYRPADMLTAAQFTSPQKLALVTNTPLSIVKTIGKAPLIEKKYFEEGDSAIYVPIREGTTRHGIRKDVNVMVVILESFGNEWLGKKNQKNFTPFLDSLLDESLYFENGFANGKKSIESIPSIFAGIPSLIDNPYISSPYGTNNIMALPQLLKEMGYSSAFYHGATNGSMKFDVFAAKLGFEHYFGRTEFNNEDQCDEAWGALDEYFMPWTVKSITKELKEPFLAGLFTLSSHHPYYVPEEHRKHLPSGSHPMAQSVAYTDMSLRLFFEEAKKQSWYQNTVFVLVADHTPAGNTPQFQSRTGMFRIPIAIFDPQKQIRPKVSSEIYNQIDLLPTILDLTGFPDDVYSFGKSYFERKVPFSINYIDNSYLYFQDDYMINFIDDETTGIYNYKTDTLMYYDSTEFYLPLRDEMQNKLKGFIQRYNHDLIYNETILK